MTNVTLADPVFAAGGGSEHSAREKFLLDAATGRTASSKFNPPASGRIAGSVAAQRTYEQGLAASGLDGTRVLMPPVARPAPPSRVKARDAYQTERTDLHAGPPGPRRIAFGERKNDMSPRIDPYGVAAHRRARPAPPFSLARSMSEAARIVCRPPSNGAISGVPDGSLAASGG